MSQKVNDSMTTAHLQKSNDTLLRTLTTHHLQQQLTKPAGPSQGQNSGSTSSGTGSTPQQGSSGEKK